MQYGAACNLINILLAGLYFVSSHLWLTFKDPTAITMPSSRFSSLASFVLYPSLSFSCSHPLPAVWWVAPWELPAVSNGSFLFHLAASLGSMHKECSLSDMILPCCLQMLYSEGFFFSFPAISIPSVFVSYWILFSFFLFFFFPKPLKVLVLNFQKELVQLNNECFWGF